MQRSARPKSAKGKSRPTPPSNPRTRGSISFRQSSIRHSNPTSSTSGTTLSAGDSSISDENKPSTSKAPDPEEFPRVSRPISSLSRYQILPDIPATPSGKREHNEFYSGSPVESEIELDLMSSFAQQMILDSSAQQRTNSVKVAQNAVPHVPVKPRMSNTVVKPKNYQIMTPKVSTAVRRQGDSSHKDSPVHKKWKSSPTRSVFQQHGNLRQGFTTNSRPEEPSPLVENAKKIKLALKLPDGKRVERTFTANDTLVTVMKFAQTKMRTPSRNCNVFTMLQVPKKLLKNWNRTLADLEVVDRMVLYIEEKD